VNRWRSHFIKRAVHPVADFEVFFEGFEVDVGGFFLDRLIEDEIDVADDRRGVGLGFEICSVQALAADFELAEDVFHRLAFAAVTLVDLRLDEVIGGDHDVDFAAQGEAQVFRRLRVERIDQRDVETGFVKVDGQRAVEPGGAGGNEREQGFGRRPVRQIHHAGVQLGSDDRPNVVAALDDLEVC